jgi:hypothetical protein
LRGGPVSRLCGICAFVKLGRLFKWNLLASSQMARTVFVRINLYAQIDEGFCVRRFVVKSANRRGQGIYT